MCCFFFLPLQISVPSSVNSILEKRSLSQGTLMKIKCDNAREGLIQTLPGPGWVSALWDIEQDTGVLQHRTRVVSLTLGHRLCLLPWIGIAGVSQEVGDYDFLKKYFLKFKCLGSSGTQYESWLYKPWRATVLQNPHCSLNSNGIPSAATSPILELTFYFFHYISRFLAG